MTAAARITQADMERAVRAARAAGGPTARVVVDLSNRKLEIVLGEPANEQSPNPWDDDDGP